MFIYIDGNIVENYPLNSAYVINNHHLTLAATQGSGIKFDNLRISIQYQQKLQELENSPQAIYTTLKENSEIIWILVGLLSIGLLGYWAYRYTVFGRKKSYDPANGKNGVLSKLFENNTNTTYPF